MDERPDNQPAAYDAEGRPLYYHAEPQTNQPTAPAAPATENAPTPDVATEPTKTSVEAALSAEKYTESVRLYPDLNLGAEEFVVIDVERSMFGLVLIWLVACSAFLATVAATIMASQLTGGVNSYVVMIGLSLAVACSIGGAVASYIYRQNYFIVTNERVIARIQNSPFSIMNQNVELEHVEDCSYTQNGIIQTLVGYGAIRLSTVGDEQTYKFNFVRNPSEQFRIVNQVIQAVDEGEPTKYP